MPGGVLGMSVNELVVEHRITTGMHEAVGSSYRAVFGIELLADSMMLMPAWPSAGPTGGAAWPCPPRFWSFTDPVNSSGCHCDSLF